MEVKLKKLNHYDNTYPLPAYETPGSAGVDVRAMLEEKDLLIQAGQRVLIPTGLTMEIPQGYEVQVRPRSGLSFKTNLMVVNSPGTIDSDYRGEVKIIMGNFGNEEIKIEHGMRIAQFVFAKAPQVKWSEVKSELSETERSSDGFGSTGTH